MRSICTRYVENHPKSIKTEVGVEGPTPVLLTLDLLYSPDEIFVLRDNYVTQIYKGLNTETRTLFNGTVPITRCDVYGKYTDYGVSEILLSQTQNVL